MNILTDNEEIIKIIETLFQSGITKDLSKLREIHLDDPKFSRPRNLDQINGCLPLLLGSRVG